MKLSNLAKSRTIIAAAALMLAGGVAQAGQVQELQPQAYSAPPPVPYHLEQFIAGTAMRFKG